MINPKLGPSPKSDIRLEIGETTKGGNYMDGFLVEER
jgi:hypothetical protein